VHIPLELDAHPEKFSADGYHPSVDGYAELGDHIAVVIAGAVAGWATWDEAKLASPIPANIAG